MYGSTINIFDESRLSPNTVIFLSTLWFRTDWTTNFNREHTQQDTFYNDKGQELIVSMMNRESLDGIFDCPDHNFRIIFSSLTTPNMFSAIVLPRDENTVHDVLKNFKINELKTYFDQSKLKYVKLKLPKFTIRAKNDFENILMNFGITDIFDQTSADFGRMTSQNVFIGSLVQVSNMVIDEGDMVKTDSNPQMQKSNSEPYHFFVTRPFLVFIYSSAEKAVIISAVVTHPNVV
ncbi:Glia-derived nexin [Thelohanellus kitauei]|uniref:Glia-derived nexin n=1 Tax=Thelohanellus kitauei TaxID=669202 RepID=A0A0C2MDH6_THEKT|nr:Glia-derived nexin [Thelohanellus kitauei]